MSDYIKKGGHRSEFYRVDGGYYSDIGDLLRILHICHLEKDAKTKLNKFCQIHHGVFAKSHLDVCIEQECILIIEYQCGRHRRVFEFSS